MRFDAVQDAQPERMYPAASMEANLSYRSAALLAASSLVLVPACATTGHVERYGAPIQATASSEPALPVAELLADPERHDGETLTIAGTVREVCRKKGCWMILAAGERQMRVIFQDYAFFVPLDSAGAEVRAAGRFSIRDVSAEQTRHYLEDAGRHAEAQTITAPVRSYTFVASGVELVR